MRYLLPLLLLLTACSSAPAATPTLVSMVDEPSTPTPSATPTPPATPTPLPSCDPNMPYDVLTEEMLTYKEHGEVTTTTETRFASGGDHHSVTYDEEGNVTYQALWKDGVNWYKFGDQDWDETIGGGGDRLGNACGPIPHESGYFAKGLWLYRYVGRHDTGRRDGQASGKRPAVRAGRSEDTAMGQPAGLHRAHRDRD